MSASIPHNVGSSSAWQSLYKSKDSRWNDLFRMGMIVTPVTFLLACATLYIIVYLGALGGAWLLPRTINQFTSLMITLKIGIVIGLPLIVGLTSIILILRLVMQLFKGIYLPPAHLKTGTLIRYRLLGVPPVPPPLDNFVSYPYMLFMKPEFDEEKHWSARWVGGPASLIIYDGVALYLERGNRFSRVVGPGMPVPFLDRFETIKAVVDLRPNLIHMPGKFWSKDGIPIKVNIRIECQINSSENARAKSENLVYPFDPVEVRKSVERRTVKRDPDTKQLVESDWLESVKGRVGGSVGAYISSHRMDELFLNNHGTTHLLSEDATREIVEKLNKSLVVDGVRIRSLQIMNVLDENVDNQRVAYWKAERQKDILHRQGETKATRLRAQEQVRAEAERDVMAVIIESLKNIGPTHFTEPLLLSLSGILEQTLDDPMARVYLADQSLTALEKLRQFMNDGSFREDTP